MSNNDLVDLPGKRMKFRVRNGIMRFPVKVEKVDVGASRIIKSSDWEIRCRSSKQQRDSTRLGELQVIVLD